MVLQTAMSSTELMLAWCIASAAPYGLDAAFLNVCEIKDEFVVAIV
jgi:hypothetical protein